MKVYGTSRPRKKKQKKKEKKLWSFRLKLESRECMRGRRKSRAHYWSINRMGVPYKFKSEKGHLVGGALTNKRAMGPPYPPCPLHFRVLSPWGILPSHKVWIHGSIAFDSYCVLHLLNLINVCNDYIPPKATVTNSILDLHVSLFIIILWSIWCLCSYSIPNVLFT